MAAELLTFDEERHEYRFMGEVVPGVTSILKPLVDFSGIPRDVLAAKADLGRRVHETCQFWDEDDLDEESVQADVEPYLKAWKLFRKTTGAQVLQNERPVYEPLMNYAGTLDRVIQFDGAKWLIDLKTCFTTPLSAGPQTAAYLRALGDNTVSRRAALRLRPDGTYRLDPLTGADDWSVFMSCLTLNRFLEKNQ